MMCGVLHDPVPPRHYVTHTWVPLCSCGWTGTPEPTEKGANMALQAHAQGFGDDGLCVKCRGYGEHFETCDYYRERV